MQEQSVAVVPVGKIKGEELEPVLSRAARALRQPLELRGNIPVPQGAQDPARGQFRAGVLLVKLRALFPQLRPGKMIGAEAGAGGAPPPKPDIILFVTDADLFTADSEAAFSAMLSARKLGVISVRRLREAFYRRSADANKQRARLTKEVIRLAARMQGMPQCSNPECVLAASAMLADVDMKQEKFCRPCYQRKFQGTIAH